MDARLRRLQPASRAAPGGHAPHARSGTGGLERTPPRSRRRRRRQPGFDLQPHRRAPDDAPRDAAALPPRRKPLHRQRDADDKAGHEVMTMKRMMILFVLLAAVASAQQPPAATPAPVQPPSVPNHYDGVASCANSG